MNKVDEIAEELRHEPYHILSMRCNCIGKSFRFKKKCLNAGIKARVMICLGIVRLGPLIKIPVIYGCGEVDNKRIEVARPLDKKNLWGTFDIDLEPIFAIWI